MGYTLERARVFDDEHIERAKLAVDQCVAAILLVGPSKSTARVRPVQFRERDRCKGNP
jgi:hypothetical protein